MRTLRDLTRRRLRTGLTVTGVTIGIWALVVFSAMAAKVDALVSGGSDYHAGKIIVSDGGFAGLGGQPMRLALTGDILGIDGVDVVVPSVAMVAQEAQAVSLGPPDQIRGTPVVADAGRETDVPRIASGRRLTADDEGSLVAVIGSSIAAKRSVGVGETMALYGHDLEVVGVLEETLSTPDVTVALPFTTAQRLIHGQLPAITREGVTASELATSFMVYPAPGSDHAAVAAAIEARMPGLTALTGDEYDRSVGTSMSIFNAILVGIALISLVVGGLSVIDTMAMSVAERTREIGVKRAIGSSRSRIVRELMAESGLIGAFGGVLGIVLGALVVVLVNEAGRPSGTVLFDLTPATAVLALAFSMILGVVAGIVPAWSAARLDPVAALRFE